MQSLWSARKQALWANLAVRPEGTQIWSTDVAVPLSRMAELIGEMTDPRSFEKLTSSRNIQGESEQARLVQQCPRTRRRWKLSPGGNVQPGCRETAKGSLGLCRFDDGECPGDGRHSVWRAWNRTWKEGEYRFKYLFLLD